MSSLVHNVKNFVSLDEIEKIKKEVHSMESEWKSFSDYNRYKRYKNIWQNKDNMQHILGDAIYLIHTFDNGPSREEINWHLRSKLIQKFDWLYVKLFQEIKKTFNVEKVSFDDTLPIPGFHIFGKYEIPKTEFIVHQDTGILDYYPEIDENLIRSFVLLIQSPKTPPCLDIVFSGEHAHLSESVPYEYGTLHFWYGIIPHRIGAFALEKDEFRITFQGHFYVEPDTGVVKLYF
jgi:hypothetical protein